MDKYLKDKLESLKAVPGVYQFLNASGEVLYVGKAKSLKNRVKNYFKELEERPQIVALMPEVKDVKVLETDSEVEALLLEAKLIEELTPPANIRLRDNKSFISVGITNEDFPRVLTLRQRDLEEGNILPGNFRSLFGPFPSGLLLKTAMRTIRKMLPYRDCGPLKFQAHHKRERPCLFGFIGVCPAPCTQNVDIEKYHRYIVQLEKFLSGQKNEVMKEIESDMQRTALDQDFERAAELRDRLNALKHIQEVSLFEGEDVAQEGDKRIEGFDISNISGTSAVGSMVVFVAGKKAPSFYKKFRIRSKNAPDDLLMMKEVLKRRIMHSIGLKDPAWPMPDMWLIDGGQTHLNITKEVLKNARVDMPVLAVSKGRRRKKAEMHTFEKEKISEILGDNPESLIRKIRDEAHRYAIGYHRGVRSRATFKSIFDEIPGIGKPTKIKLLKTFGTASKIRNADRDELIETVGKARAEKILQYFNKDSWQ